MGWLIKVGSHVDGSFGFPQHELVSADHGERLVSGEEGLDSRFTNANAGEMVPIRSDQPPRIITAVVHSFHDEFRKSPISSRSPRAMQIEFRTMLRMPWLTRMPLWGRSPVPRRRNRVQITPENHKKL